MEDVKRIVEQKVSVEGRINALYYVLDLPSKQKIMTAMYMDSMDQSSDELISDKSIIKIKDSSSQISTYKVYRQHGGSGSLLMYESIIKRDEEGRVVESYTSDKTISNENYRIAYDDNGDKDRYTVYINDTVRMTYDVSTGETIPVIIGNDTQDNRFEKILDYNDDGTLLSVTEFKTGTPKGARIVISDSVKQEDNENIVKRVVNMETSENDGLNWTNIGSLTITEDSELNSISYTSINMRIDSYDLLLNNTVLNPYKSMLAYFDKAYDSGSKYVHAIYLNDETYGGIKHTTKADVHDRYKTYTNPLTQRPIFTRISYYENSVYEEHTDEVGASYVKHVYLRNQLKQLTYYKNVHQRDEDPTVIKFISRYPPFVASEESLTGFIFPEAKRIMTYNETNPNKFRIKSEGCPPIIDSNGNNFEITEGHTEEDYVEAVMDQTRYVRYDRSTRTVELLNEFKAVMLRVTFDLDTGDYHETMYGEVISLD
jgi:hypothetical protein